MEPYCFAALQRYSVEAIAGCMPSQALIAVGVTLLLTLNLSRDRILAYQDIYFINNL